VVDERITALEQAVPVSGLLGYLNFSDGRPDPRWQRQLDDAFAFLVNHGDDAPWQTLLDSLPVLLRRLHENGAAAFRDVRQAEGALALAARVLPAYRRHHADLLAHLTDAELFNSFFLARVFETVLRQGTANAGEEAATAVIARLNDFVGHRPIALLETRPRGEPYDHERTRPVPLWIQGAGPASGRYQAVVLRALELLEATDPDILAEAQFDPKLLDEVALDVRAYDHSHPVNRRPNYVFGEWDPHHLDNQGRYRRYVVRKVTLDALIERVEQGGSVSPAELLEEAAAVLAGTILMASGTSGASPTAYDSTTTLAALLPRIARYRDAFYEHLLRRTSGTHGGRLRQEREVMRQPFGAARQHLNAYLARNRAAQMQQRYLALLFAEMGYAEASREEAERIAVVSVRLASAVLGRLTAGRVDVEASAFRAAAACLPEAEDLIDRGIACGAFADPWNVLGFQGLFPLSPAREDSVRDNRLDELVGLVEQLFNLYARLISEGAAVGDDNLVQSLTAALEKRTAWWDRFATYEVSDIRRVHGGEAATSAAHVAKALARWHARGEAPADLAFWRGLLEGFRSPKSFALVVDTLLHKEDYRAAQALLTAWLGRAEQVPLEDGVWSFPTLALRWMLALTRGAPGAERGARVFEESGVFAITTPRSALPLRERQSLVLKFFDYLEANAEEFWQVPALELHGSGEQPDEEDDTEGLYSAAYDDVTYQDSTDDSEGEVSDGGPADEFDLEQESGRLEKRLRFLSTVARLWQVAARFLAAVHTDGAGSPEAQTALIGWLESARGNRHKLLTLLDAIHVYPLPDPGGAYDALVEFDRRRVLKEQLLYTAIGTCLDTSLAAGALHGTLDAMAFDAERAGQGTEGEDKESTLRTALRASHSADDNAPPWEAAAIRLEQALFRGEAAAAREALGQFLEGFQQEPLLVTPLTEGGQPRQVLRVRIAQTVLRALLANLPRLGLIRETFDLLKAARTMEQAQPPRGRGVTEFNHFFQASYQAVLESVIESAGTWDAEHSGDTELVEMLERLTTPFLELWGEHSRSLQLSVLETVGGDAEWAALQTFVQRYGGDLFHARFLTLANLRGVLHRGVGPYLDYLRDNPDPLRPVKLIDDIGRSIRREDAIRRLEVVLQAVIESYEEYKDYNTTTTQSDYGENLHVLLDFLRLKAGYERHAWQFRPLVLAHEVLARRGRNAAAVLWERQLTQFTRELARKHLDQLVALEKARGVRLGTISDRLGERFVKPLALDRLAALIEPAMNETRRDGPRPAFARLRNELPAYTATPAGVGLDVPYWLRRLEIEVRRVQAMQSTIAVLAESFFRVPRRPLAYDELQRQLREWGRPALPE
jgi:hypothetical protein